MKAFRLTFSRLALLLTLLAGAGVAVAQPAPVVVIATPAAPFEEIRGFIYLAITLCILLPLIPVAAYLRTGWFAKRNDITAGVSEEAKARYLQMFSLAGPVRIDRTGKRDQRQPGKQAGGHDKIFEDFYSHWYGRGRYVPPIILFVAVLGFLSYLIGFSVASLFPYWETHDPTWAYSLNPTSLSAIAGAYLWVTSDFIRRARRLDLAPSDIHWGTLRLVIAVPMGYAFAGFSAMDAGGLVRAPAQVVASVIAFSLGALPLSAIQDILRQSLYKRFTTSVHEVDSADAVTELQGIDDDIAMRLENEGITTIPQLASCDPVRLAMRSNLPFNFVIDCMNQALCWVYFEGQVDKLRPLGLRGAVDITALLNALDAPDPQVRSGAEATLSDVVAAIEPPHTVATLHYTFAQIAGNPFARFLASVLNQPAAPGAGTTFTGLAATAGEAWNGTQGNVAVEGEAPRTTH